MRRVVFDHKLLPYLLLAPQLIVLLWFFFWPAGQAFWSAFTITDAFGGNAQFVWFENFAREFRSPEYRKSVGVTLVFTVLTTGLSLGLGLLFALAVDRVIRLAAVYRVLAMRWRWWCWPRPGSRSATISCSFFAGLQAMPRSVIEAAAIDGARFWRRFRTIVLPLLSPTTFFLLVVNVVYAFFETFGVIHTITSGGPQQATTILVYKVYSDGFVGQDLGSSAAQSVILLIVVGALTVLQFKYIEKRVHY
jgi:sn-glycerol 3-phosphate transport system permease protein